jgi:hypothetical protein
LRIMTIQLLSTIIDPNLDIHQIQLLHHRVRQGHLMAQRGILSNYSFSSPQLNLHSGSNKSNEEMVR